MTSYLLDADYAIDALANKRGTVELLSDLAPDGIAISILTMGEILEGAYDLPDPQPKLAMYRSFLAPFAVLGIDESIIERFAEVRASLRRRGEIIPDFDILTGVTALHHGLTLLTRNVRHLSRVPGIKIYDA